MPSKSLNFTMQHQTENNWCWAAVSTSMALFYNSSSSWTQCKVANQTLRLSTCCKNPGSSSCNKPWYLNDALTTVGHFQSAASGSQPLSTVQTEVDNNTPLGCRIQWRPRGGHFVVLSGYNTGGNTVDVRDPWYGNSNGLSYNTFMNNYQGNGYWNYTYYTKP